MIGTQVGSWIIESHLGRGGMSQVYLARHRTLDTLAAVKVLAPTLDQDEFRKRFFQEAKTQARLRHPNIAHVLDYIEQDGRWFLVVEYMEKGSLADHLQTLTRPLPALGAITYTSQALAGLGHAHEHGVVHRDIKPANLLLNDRNEVSVTDFGIAMVEGESRLTSTGLSVGTPRYMSPEQITDPRGVDHRCDIYSMGIVLYQLLLGRVPFESSSSMEILHAQVYDTPPPMHQIDPRIPPQLERIVLRALTKKPAERYSSCGEFAAALKDWFARSQPSTAAAVHHDATLHAAGEEPTLRAAAEESARRVAPQVAAPAVSLPAPSSAPAPSAPRSSARGLPIAAVLGVILLLGGATAVLFVRGVLPALKRSLAGAEAASPPIDRTPRAPSAPATAPPEPSAPAPIASPVRAAPPARAPSLPTPATPSPPAAIVRPPETSRPAPTPVLRARRAVPRLLVVGAGEPALAAAAQDALARGLGGTGEVVAAGSVAGLARLLRGGGPPEVSELLDIARTADIDVFVLAEALVLGDEVRDTGTRQFVALTSRLEISAFIVPSGDGLGPGWGAQVRYAAASAGTYGGRAIEPLLPEISGEIERGWSAYSGTAADERP